jgi:hypothetical protein
MIQSLPINDRYHTVSPELAARRTQARIHRLNSNLTAPVNPPHNPPSAHWHRAAHPPSSAKITLHPLPPHLTSIANVPKSP